MKATTARLRDTEAASDEACPRHIHRRTFIGASLATAIAASMEARFPRAASAGALTAAQRKTMTPDDIIAAMKRGNSRFRRGAESPHNYLSQQKATAAAQYPAAVILSCIDSRAPAETIMDLGIGDVFNARVAGNIVNEDILGSMEFACKLVGARVALVMGHTSCGAIKGAIDHAELGNLTALLSKIRPAVDATEFSGDRSAKNAAFVDAVARKNVELSMANIRSGSPVLAELESTGKIKLVGAMYNLETGAVEFYS
jgi:carbonic anhydrase